MNSLSLFMLSMTMSIGVGSISAAPEQPKTPLLLTTLQQIEHEEEKPVEIAQPPVSYHLQDATFVSQTYNNCGPAALSMVFSNYNLSISQEELATKMRPFNSPMGGDDDKSVFPDEFVTTAQEYGFKALYRPNGNEELLKKLIANDIPVVVRTWLNPGEDIGHYRIINGYDDAAQVFMQDDSYQGKGLTYSYADVMEMWKAFNYSYILVYPKEKQALVEAIVGEDMDQQIAYKHALTRAEKELKENPDDFYAEFNRSTTLYHLGDSKNSVAAYDKIKDQLPDRILWYQNEPLYAYQKEKRYDRIMEISEGILTHGNMAYSELYQLRGEIYLERGEMEAARKEFELALYYNTNFDPAKKALAKI